MACSVKYFAHKVKKSSLKYDVKMFQIRQQFIRTVYVIPNSATIRFATIKI